MSKPLSKAMNPSVSPAYYVQAVLSFGASLAALAIGVAYLPVTGWIRGFLAVGVLYVVTSAFTLAKVVRDRQEVTQVTSRVDQARLDRLLAEHDPFKGD
ncbi:YiaA/YiaB family inner membrane protein [Spongiactinospora sp. TRM90649]|uniref:YiaA/YiaB family inner membrane protein n=1 Tax=Spongiactinospora sp. TRM90649 TaxID=3031114 RepID=UPI0023F9D9BC|nr:YiaA/YiaB family inner membrane protein [Spongiactinospora sp. TRM90649]MDF5756766.1 YiaA/YiaB family inner membrane protein [Spongiactinospora sp. TRM90649]